MNRIAVIAASIWLVFVAAEPARASAILTMVQEPTGVVVAGSGSFDVSALTPDFNVLASPGMLPSQGNLVVGALGFVDADLYSGGISGPSSFGPGGVLAFPTLGSGPRFGIIRGAQIFLIVPDNYVSGSPIPNAINTYAGTTYASLGVTPGTYVWSWGSGDHRDSLTLQIDPATPVPEPTSMTLLAFGLAGLGARRWRQRART